MVLLECDAFLVALNRMYRDHKEGTVWVTFKRGPLAPTRRTAHHATQ